MKKTDLKELTFCIPVRIDSEYRLRNLLAVLRFYATHIHANYILLEADEHLQFVLLTGVTKFSQVSVFSGFNQPADISMDPRYEALCGITTEELYQYFDKSIVELADSYGYSIEETKELHRLQYDGYHFGRKLMDIYNPFSLLNVFASQNIQDYWFRSGTPTYLIRLLNHTQENLNELTEIKNDELKHILGGACTDYSCNCFSDSPQLTSDISNLTLDNRSSNGYIP